jgi:hypothetical protein
MAMTIHTPLEDILALFHVLVSEALPDLIEVALFDVISLSEELNVLQKRKEGVLELLLCPPLDWLGQDGFQYFYLSVLLKRLLEGWQVLQGFDLFLHCKLFLGQGYLLLGLLCTLLIFMFPIIDER